MHTGKSRWNWGLGLALSLGAFMLLMMGFLTYTLLQKAEPPEPHAYEQGLNYEQELQARRNTLALPRQPSLRTGTGGLQVEIPQEGATDIRLSLLRPNDPSQDLIVRLDSHRAVVPLHRLQPGRWEARLQWQDGGKAYLHTQFLSLP
ncbi:MAG: FixH family protein [Sphingobacteriia bacterium]|jgi:hypothetical protein